MLPSAFGRPTTVEMIDLSCMAAPTLSKSKREFRHVDPAALLPALQRAFDELDALRALDQRVRVGGILDDVADEHLPLRLEAVVVDGVVRHRHPGLAEVD